MGLADLGTAHVQAQVHRHLHSHGHAHDPFDPEGHFDGGHSYIRGASPALVGTTLLGRHSIAEVRELAALVDFQAHATDELIAKHQPVPANATDAVRRWTAWRDAWQKARDKALFDGKLLSFASPLTPDFAVDAEAPYQRLKCAINVSCDESHTDPRDMREIINAVEAGLKEASDLSGFRARFPAESAVPDTNLDAKTAQATTDAAIRALESMHGAPQPAKFTIPWWGYALGVVMIGGIGYSFWRVHKKAEAAARDRAARDPLEGLTLPLHMTSPPSPIAAASPDPPVI